MYFKSLQPMISSTFRLKKIGGKAIKLIGQDLISIPSSSSSFAISFINDWHSITVSSSNCWNLCANATEWKRYPNLKFGQSST
ncbi:hypothetical protein GIB67_004115 [Kingdonia uniflora]|uniref:Uncharacterized protein n=1 Tax=Kingdonia uniflora TaxID=39325 RepID=A0A7J7NRJ6_9MAGN|nr:hypothetical protein GIB67_040572 [Kingdonia uniflora]KAF6169723.1 hypothetical protein GIB67_004115 [Kingdonia uniflora]